MARSSNLERLIINDQLSSGDSFDNTTSGLSATTIKDAIDEIDSSVDSLLVDQHSLVTLDSGNVTQETLSLNDQLLTVSLATTTTAGALSAADKLKLDDDLTGPGIVALLDTELGSTAWQINTTYSNLSEFTNDVGFLTTVSWGNIIGTLSDQTDLNNALSDKADSSSLSTVATSGNSSDLTNDAGFITGTAWGDITGTLSNQTDLNNALGNKADTSSLSTVATSGNSSDLNNDAGFITGIAWGDITGTLSNQTDLNNALGDKADTSSLATVATSGNSSDLNNDEGFITGIAWGDITGTLADQTDLNNALGDKADSSSLATVATSGNSSDLNNDANFVLSDTSGITGANVINNVVSLTQAEYDAIGTPDASTLYYITD